MQGQCRFVPSIWDLSGLCSAHAINRGAPVSLAQAEIPEQSIEALADNAMEFAKSMDMEEAMTRDDMVKVPHLAAA